MANHKTNKSSFDVLKSIFKNKNVIFSLSITGFLVLLFHLLSTITLPGITPGKFTADSNGFAGMLNLLAGGGLSRMSILAVGVSPYITSQIIVQLLSSDLIPPLSRAAKQGERGRRKLEIVTRIITLPFAVAQGYAVIALMLQSSAQTGVKIFGHDALNQLNLGETFGLLFILTAGTYICIFLGDMITKRGVGNGITLLILSGIVSSFFSDFTVAFQTIASSISSSSEVRLLTVILSCTLYVIFYIAILFAVIFVNASTRKIPIQQTGQGLMTDFNDLPYLPIKINSAGVIPVIFASSLMTIPGTIAQFLPDSSEVKWFIVGNASSKGYLTLDS
jgi:preprotein translocase subunit SecY